MTLKRRLHADWPIRVFYGLITAYQGLFGFFLPSSIFYEALRDHAWAVTFVSCLLVSGALLVADGVIGMIMYCTSVQCGSMNRAMRWFQRWRHLLFLPPVFCYYVALLSFDTTQGEGSAVVYGYYITLAMCGVVASIRDGIITNHCDRGGVR